MSRPPCERFPDYARWIRSLIASQYRAIILDIVALRFHPQGHRAGRVLFPRELTHVKLTTSPTGIVFRDGSFLVGYEAVEISNRGTVTPLVYKYHYLRPMDDYYFRYDKPVEPGSEPPCHLHVLWEGPPRFPTHAVDLAEVLELIQRSFFDPTARAAWIPPLERLQVRMENLEA